MCCRSCRIIARVATGQGEAAPMALVTYDETRPWARKMAAAVEMKMMPPWFADPRYGHFANDPSLTEQQIATISNWAEAGAPAGDAHDSPAPRKWAEGWTIPQPNSVVKMPKAVRIPARGEVEYTYEIVPTHFSGGPVGANVGTAAVEHGACASCGGLHSSTGFGVAEACAGGGAIHCVDAERSGRTATGA